MAGLLAEKHWNFNNFHTPMLLAPPEYTFQQELWSIKQILLVVSTPLKNPRQNGNLPQIGLKIKKKSNHHPNILPKHTRRSRLWQAASLHLIHGWHHQARCFRFIGHGAVFEAFRYRHQGTEVEGTGRNIVQVLDSWERWLRVEGVGYGQIIRFHQARFPEK